MADADERKRLAIPDNWYVHSTYKKEHEAEADLVWLNRKSNPIRKREYLLVAKFSKPVRLTKDTLNDDLPY